MKRVWKRGLAFLCATLLFVQTIAMGGDWMKDVFASDAPTQSEWYFLKDETLIEKDAKEKNFSFKKENANLNLTDGLQRKDVNLSFTVRIPSKKANGADNSAALEAMKQIVVRIAQEKSGNAMLHINLTNTDYVKGFKLDQDNTVVLNLANENIQYVLGSADKGFNLDETIQAIHIYSAVKNMSDEEAYIKDVKLVDNREPGLEFGASRTEDTYLELSSPLADMPQTIEASIKGENPNVSEWTLLESNVANVAGDYKTNATAKATVTRYTSTATDKPGAGHAYMKFLSTSGYSFTSELRDLDINVSKYEPSELAIEFWVHVDGNGRTVTNELLFEQTGRIRISNSSTGKDTDANLDLIYRNVPKVNSGWNKITLPLSAFETTYPVGDANHKVYNRRQCIKSFKFHGCKNTDDKAKTLRIGEVKLVVTSTADADEWVLRNGGNLTGLPASTTGTTVAGDTPGAGMKYVAPITGQSFSATTKFEKITINTHQKSNLAVKFWIYSERAGQLFKGGRLRLSNDGEGYDSNANLDYVAAQINVGAGWNEITLPLSKWQPYTDWVSTAKAFDWNAGVKTFRLHGVTVNNNLGTVKIGEIKLAVIDQEWTLRAGNNTTGITGATTGTTVAADAPGAGMQYVSLIGNQQFSATTKFDSIAVNTYDKSKLAVKFWVYSETAGKLFKGGRIRMSNDGEGYDRSSANLDYVAGNIQVQAGWQEITLPLNTWQPFTDWASALNYMPMAFDWNAGVKTFRFNGVTVEPSRGTVKIGAIRLVTMLDDAEWSLRAGDLLNGLPMSSSDTTVAGETPGAGVKYVSPIAGINFSAVTKFDKIDVNQYDKKDLSVKFWVYSEKAGKLFNGGRLRLSNDGEGYDKTSANLDYVAGNIQVQAGWQEITLPLDQWQPFTEWASALNYTPMTFDWAAGVKTFRLHGVAVNKELGNVKIGEIKLTVADEAVKKAKVEVTDHLDATQMEWNYMIFSNTNSTKEENPYALFVTEDGYPALLYGKQQFILTQNVLVDEWVDIAVVRDSDGYINFYVDGKFVAKSDVKAKDSSRPTTPHCIGADASGGQIFTGRIADIRVWNDARTAKEIEENRTEKKVGIIANGFDKTTEGLLGSWYLMGDIQYVLETMPDISKYENTAVFKGSRADDWIDYVVPTEIGEDYWTIAFVPDIQNLTDEGAGKRAYAETWRTMSQWIADHIEEENIKHVISAGDVTWNNKKVQYDAAMTGFDRFTDLVSWSSIIGNHDYDMKAADRDSTMYQEYFGVNAIQNSAAAATYAGSFEDPYGKTTTENSYYRFNVNGKNWMIMQLELHPRASVLNWAKAIMEQYSNDNVILTTHSYLDGVGGYTINDNMSYINESTDNAAGGYIGQSTGNIWEALKSCNNIRMILCGHSTNGTGAVVQKMETNEAGESVPALMINAQDLDAGEGMRDGASYYTEQPLGTLALLRFSQDGTKVALDYYAPTSEKTFAPAWTVANGATAGNTMQPLYKVNAKSCSHKDADNQDLTILINQNAATASTDGYTGDTYCTECGKILAYGSIIPKNSQSWILREGGITSDLTGEVKETDVAVYMTDSEDAPGAGFECIEFTSNTKLFSAQTQDLNIALSKYDPSELAVTFWVYSEADGKLFDGGRLRLSNQNNGYDSDANLDYAASDIMVKAGWNQIVLPLNEWKQFNSWVSTAPEFKWEDGIKSFKFHGCKHNNPTNRIIGEVKLIRLEKDTATTEGTNGTSAGLATGDVTRPMLWISILMISISLCIIVYRRKTQRENEVQ